MLHLYLCNSDFDLPRLRQTFISTQMKNKSHWNTQCSKKPIRMLVSVQCLFVNLITSLWEHERNSWFDRPSSWPAWICTDLGLVYKFGIAKTCVYLITLTSFICMSHLRALARTWIPSIEQYRRSTGSTICNLCSWGVCIPFS